MLPVAAALFFFFLNLHGFDVFGLEDLLAVQTFQVVHAVSPGDDLGSGMLASGLHKQGLDEIILTARRAMSSPLPQLKFCHGLQSG
jgi:hypothetical protein